MLPRVNGVLELHVVYLTFNKYGFVVVHTTGSWRPVGMASLWEWSTRISVRNPGTVHCVGLLAVL